MHLRLEYCLVRMFIGRPFLLKRDTSIGESPVNSETSPSEIHHTTDSGNYRQSSRQELIADCIEAATEALGICQDLRNNGAGLARASYVEYSSCRASLLVLIAYSIQNFSEQFRMLLFNGLEMIREMSAAGESARSEVSLIETLERALARLHTGVQQSQYGEGVSQVGNSMSDYEVFKHWGAKIRGGDAPEANSLPDQSRPPLPSNQFRTHEHMADGGSEGLPDRDIDMGMLGALDSVIGMSIFGPENSSPSAAWPIWTETQVLQHFLTNTEFEGS